MTARIGRLAEVGDRIDAATLRAVSTFRNAQKRVAVVEGLGVAVVAVIVILLGVVVGRPLIVRLRRLSGHARMVAYHLLPAVASAA
jgi:hypothetical protein